MDSKVNSLVAGIIAVLALLVWLLWPQPWQLVYTGSRGEDIEAATYDSEEACLVARTKARDDGYAARCVKK